MSPKSTHTSPSKEAYNGSAKSNSEDASQVVTQPNDYHYENSDNHSTSPDQTMDSSLYGDPPEQNSQYNQYINSTQAHIAPAFTHGDARPTSYPASHTYPHHQQNYYTADLVYSYGNARYPAEISARDVQTPLHQTPTLNGAYLTRDQTYQGNDHITRPHIPINRQPTRSPSEAWGENRIHTQSSDAHASTSPPSPQTQRYIEAQTPEERLRLGYPRFQDQQQQIDYYGQQQTGYYTFLNSTGRQ